MKRLTLVLALLVVGCESAYPNLTKTEINGFRAQEFEHEGHKYLVFSKGEACSAIHSESCSCKLKAERQ